MLGTTDGRVAIVAQPAGEHHALPLRLEVSGLAARKRLRLLGPAATVRTV